MVPKRSRHSKKCNVHIRMPFRFDQANKKNLSYTLQDINYTITTNYSLNFVGTRKVSPFCARPKRSHYKAVTSQIAQKTRVLWLTRGFPEEKLLWSDSWALNCKLQGQDSHNESMCVSFLKRKRIKERSGLI